MQSQTLSRFFLCCVLLASFWQGCIETCLPSEGGTGETCIQADMPSDLHMDEEDEGHDEAASDVEVDEVVDSARHSSTNQRPT